MKHPQAVGRWIKRVCSRQAIADGFWVFLLVVTILLIRIGLPITKIILAACLSIFVLRFAPRIPGLRWLWVGLFGERTFWDWMTLLCAPILLSSIGIMISTSINNQQSDVSITKERLDLSNEYYNRMSELILSPEFQKLIKDKKAKSLSEPTPSNDEEDCNPDAENPLSSIAYSRTASALRTLSHLRTSAERYTPMQQSLLQLLFYSGLIQRRGHVVSLQQTQFTGASLSDIDLSNSCFDSVNFGGAFMRRTRLDNSNLIRTNFKGANLIEARLRSVNLSAFSNLEEINAVEANFEGSDLRQAKFDNSILHKDFSKDFQKRHQKKSRDAYSSNDLPKQETGTNFQRTNLQKASFVNADLRGARFNGASLLDADLRNADLRGADLRNIQINAKTNLNGAKFNTIILDNFASIKAREAFLLVMKNLGLDHVFDIGGLKGTPFRLEPTKFDPAISPSRLGMRLDHSL